MTKSNNFLIFICISLFTLIFCSTSFAAETDIVSQIVTKFSQKTNTWESAFTDASKNLFMICVTLEVAWIGIQIALGRQDLGEAIKQFALTLCTAGFFLAVIVNYKEWSWMIINGLDSLAGQVIPLEKASERAFQIGLDLVGKIFEVIGDTSILSDGGASKIFGLIFATLIILVCFALITSQIVLIKCEAMVAMMAALILVGFGGTSFLRDYAKNAMRYVLSVAFKLFVMSLVLGLGISFINDFMSLANVEFTDACVIVGTSIVILALIKSLPDTVAGIINGSHVGGGIALMATAASVGGAALGAAKLSAKGAMNTKERCSP